MSCRSFALRRRALRPRAGFTLVELLVVISIIGMLMALLLPAVQQAREAGRRNTCNSNLHNISLAVMNFATSKNSYPGYVESLSLQSTTGTSMNLPVSWVVPILPYMERTDVYTLWRNQPNWSIAYPLSGGNYPPPVYMNVLNCPSSPVSTTTNNTPCVYVTNSGMMDALASAAYPADWQANGVFFNHFNTIVNVYGGATGTVAAAVANTAITGSSATGSVQSASISQDYITVHDGSSLTLMLSENNNAPLAGLGSSGSGAVTATGNPNPGPGYWGSGSGAPMSGSMFTWGTEPQNCFVWWPDSNPYPQMKINAPQPGAASGGAGGSGSTSATNYNYYMHPASNHPTGVNVAFCDGHSQFMSQDIDYTVFCLLMTPYGAYCNTPGYMPASGGTPLDSGTSNATYYPNGSNYLPLRTRPVDESQIR